MEKKAAEQLLFWNFEPGLSLAGALGSLYVGPVGERYLEKQYRPNKFSHNTFRQLQYFMLHKLDFARKTPDFYALLCPTTIFLGLS